MPSFFCTLAVSALVLTFELFSSSEETEALSDSLPPFTDWFCETSVDSLKYLSIFSSPSLGFLSIISPATCHLKVSVTLTLIALL